MYRSYRKDSMILYDIVKKKFLHGFHLRDTMKKIYGWGRFLWETILDLTKLV